MKKIRFVFYKAKFEWRNVFKKGRKIRMLDDGISFWTGLFNPWTPGYSHWEGWIPDESGNFTGIWDLVNHVEDWFFGACYTSTMRDTDNGTVSRPASEVFTHPDRWEYIEFEVTDESFEQAKAWADERVRLNKGYSMRDIWRFAMPLWMLKKLKIADPDREICSEHGEGWATRLWVFHKDPVVLVRRGLFKVLIRSPRRLWRDLVKRHHVATYSLATGKRVRDEKGKRLRCVNGETQQF